MSQCPPVRSRARSPHACAARASCALVLVACMLPPGAARAQSGLLPSGPDPLAGTVVDRSDALDTLDTSYVQAQTDRLARARSEAGDELVDFDAGPYLQRSRDRFLRDAGAALYELLGDDGSLTPAEIREEIPRIRERHLNRFRDIVDAQARGYRVPPVVDEYDSGLRFAADMAIYTLATRNPALSWARLALAMLVGLIVGWCIKRGLDWLGDESAGGMRRLLERATDSVRVPLYLAATLVGLRVGLDNVWLPRGVERFVRDAVEIGIVALSLWAVWKLCTVIASSIARAVERATEAEVGVTGTLVIRRILHVLVLVGALLLLTRIVFDASLGGLLTSLGIIGVALWFVLRSVIDNLTASFTLFSDRPFRVGDTLLHDDTWVSVEDVGFRSTRLRSFDGHLFTVPNSTMVEHQIQNVSARPYIRHRFRIGIVYSTPAEKVDEAIRIVESIYSDMSDEIDLDAGAHVVFEAYGDYDLKLLVQYYTFTDDYWGGHEVNGRFNRELLARFNEAGIDFAFPTQTTVLETEDDAEPLVRLATVDDPDEADREDRQERQERQERRDAGHDEAREERRDGATDRGGDGRGAARPDGGPQDGGNEDDSGGPDRASDPASGQDADAGSDREKDGGGGGGGGHEGDEGAIDEALEKVGGQR